MLKKLSVSPIILVGVVVVILAGIVTGIEVHRQNQRPAVVAVSPTPTATPLVTDTFTPTPTGSPTPGLSISDGDVTWLATPQKVGDLKLFRADLPTNGNPGDEPIYYKVGIKGGTLDIILAQIQPEGPAQYRDGFLFIQTQYDHTHYALVTNYNSTTVHYYMTTTDGDGKVSSSFSDLADGAGTSLPSVLLPGTFTQDGIQFESKYDSYALFSELTTKSESKTVFKQTSWGPLYRVNERTLEDGTTVETLILERHDFTGQYFGPHPATFLKDDQIPTITWNDASKNASSFREDGGGSCGSATGLNVVSSLTGWAKTGTATDGTEIFEPSDNSNPIIKKWYELSGGNYYDSNGQQHSISYANFVKKHPIIAYKDSLGRNLVLRNTTYGLNAECGKPVVYLYPAQTTKVQVSVGATFHHSIPASTGIWSVTASPSGVLTAKDGQTFPYLYWSGQGKGSYPIITAGTVVARDQVQTVLRQQLDQLGFTKQEAADFLEFWAPRMPTTPYTRLTWLGNKDMDTLAPMSITPKPDVVIRRFLDFEGLQQPLPLTQQTLTAPARHGFTVMEWGGLLRGN